MKLRLPAVMGPQSAEFFASEMVELNPDQYSMVNKKFITLYLISVSWGAQHWKSPLRSIFAEIISTLTKSISKEKLIGFIQELAVLNDAHESRLATSYVKRVVTFASLLLVDLTENIDKFNVESLLAVFKATQSKIQEADEAYWEPIMTRMMAFYDKENAESVTRSDSDSEGVSEGSINPAISARQKMRNLVSPGVRPEVQVQEGLTFKIFNVERLQALAERAPSGGMTDPEGGKTKKVLMEISSNPLGSVRKLAQYKQGSLDSMYARFPHFKDVLDHIKEQITLKGCGSSGKPVLFPPILLRGNPGTGKSYFARELAKSLQVPCEGRDLSVTSEAFVLTGLDQSWRGAKPGLVFDTLIQGEYANPVLLLDEVDKARASGVNSSPIASLYSLLERDSACVFKDEFLPLELDTSKINWVLTANHGEIPEPIESRLDVFDIRDPSKEECKIIAQSVWHDVCEKELPSTHPFNLTLSEDILEIITSISPRIMRKVLTSAAGKATMQAQEEGFVVTEAQKLNITIEHLQMAMSKHLKKTKKPIGFHPSN